MGQTVSIRFVFDSVDASFNTFEGAYLDNVLVDTTCDFTQLDSGFPTLWGATALALSRPKGSEIHCRAA